MRRLPFLLPTRQWSSTPTSLKRFYCTATPTFDSITLNLSELSQKSVVTDDVRQLGKRAVSSLGNLLKEKAVMQSTCTASTAVALMRGVSVFDPAGTYQLLFHYVEENAWRGNITWTGEDLAEICRVSPRIDTTSIASVLISLVWPIVHALPTMSATQVGHVARAYATYGLQHPGLHKAIMQRTTVLAPETSVEDLSRILSALTDVSKELVDGLCKKIESSIKDIASGTLARCAAVLSVAKDRPEHVAELLERRAAEVVDSGNLGDVVELVEHMSQLRPSASFSPLFVKHLGPRLVQFKESYDPEDITKIFEACHKHNVVHEDLFGALAERACRVINAFDLASMATLVRILASFELFDPELFPLVAQRIQHMTRQKIILDPNVVGVILAAFARMNEKNNNILFSAVAQFKTSPNNITPQTAETAIASFKRLQFNHRDVAHVLEARAANRTVNTMNRH